MIQIEQKHLKLIKTILQEESDQDFFVFGSRSKQMAEKFSDLDLAYKKEISREALTRIKTKLAESSLPFTVDLVFLDDCDESFKELIQDDLQIF